MPADLRELLRRRLTVLPRSALVASLLVASSAHPTVPLIDSVEEGGGLAEAEDAGIVQVRGTAIEFTHPLLASAIYESASARDRRDAHAALANVVKETEEARAAPGAVRDRTERGGRRRAGRGAAQAGRGGRAAARAVPVAATMTPAEDKNDSGCVAPCAPGTCSPPEMLVARASSTNHARRARARPGSDAQTIYAISFMSWNELPRVNSLLERRSRKSDESDLLRALTYSADLAWVEFDASDPRRPPASVARSAVEAAGTGDDPFSFATR